MRAEAAQDSAATHEAKVQLDLEERTQDILDSTNLSRAEAVKLAKQLQAAESGADTNQSGYVTPRERRAEERRQKKRDQERRKREREERSAEIDADERQRQKERDERMTQREKDAGIDTGKGTKPKEPKGEKAAEKNGVKVEIIETRKVGQYSPRKYRVCCDFKVL